MLMLRMFNAENVDAQIVDVGEMTLEMFLNK
jgi:hypothetical protein